MDAVVTALPVWAITAVLAVVWYFGYKWWLGRDEGEMAPAPPAAPESAAPPPPPEPPSYSPPGEGGSES